MNEEDEIELYKKLEVMRRTHRTLEHKITALMQQIPYDEFSLLRYKKEKLSLRDKILTLENQLYPDIIA